MIKHTPNNTQPVHNLLQRLHQLRPRRFQSPFKLLQITLLQIKPQNKNQSNPVIQNPNKNPKDNNLLPAYSKGCEFQVARVWVQQHRKAEKQIPREWDWIQ